MTTAVDSFGAHTEASATALAAAGVVTALRYHYNISRPEVDLLHRHGIAVGIIAEFDTRTWHPPKDSPETGPDHGRKAVAVAQALGAPAGTVLWFTQDTDLQPGEYGRALSYWDGGDDIVRAAGFRVGAYAETGLMELLLDKGKADLGWEVGAYSWSNYRHSSRASLRQLVQQPAFGGVTVDLNDVLAADHGQWRPDGTAAGPGPTTIPPIQENPTGMEIVHFPNNPALFAHGCDRDGDWFRYLGGEYDPEFHGKWPSRMLGAGHDTLDAAWEKFSTAYPDLVKHP